MSIQTSTVAIFQCSTTCSNSEKGLTTIANKELMTNVIPVLPGTIAEWIDENNTLLMLPGGSCSGWDKELPEDFQQRLASWVKKGNHIFATCGGAYYCSKQTIFSFIGKEIINKTRYVQMFPGNCVGPLYQNLKIVKIRWYTGTIGHVVLLWGGVFETETEDENLKTLGKFECKKSNKPAVIQSKVGCGLAILSSVHWEWNSKDIIMCNPNLETTKMARKLDASLEFRQTCIQEIMLTLRKSS